MIRYTCIAVPDEVFDSPGFILSGPLVQNASFQIFFSRSRTCAILNVEHLVGPASDICWHVKPFGSEFWFRHSGMSIASVFNLTVNTDVISKYTNATIRLSFDFKSELLLVEVDHTETWSDRAGRVVPREGMGRLKLGWTTSDLVAKITFGTWNRPLTN